MKLPLPFLNKESEPSVEYSLALLLYDEKATAVIIQTVANQIKLLNQHTVHFSQSIESLPLEHLIEYIDKAISTAEEILPPKIETHKTVFGLKENWIEKETKKIKKEYLTKLKKVCDSLDLSPLGFMVISEAIANLLHYEEGAPLSAILAEIGKEQVDLTLFRGGAIVERINGRLAHSVPITVDTLLKHFVTPVLPARLIISEAADGKALSQQFIAFTWSKSLPFLHLPQVTTLPENFAAKAIVYGAAQQMGLEAPEIIQDVKDSLQGQTHDEKLASTTTKEEDAADKQEKLVPHNQPPATTLPVNPFGFVLDEDIAQTHAPAIPARQQHESSDVPQVDETEPVDTVDEQHEFSQDSQTNEPKRDTKKNLFAGLRDKMPPLHLPNIAFPSFGKRGLLIKLGIPLIALILILVGVFAIYYYLVHATIILSVTPKMVQQSADVTFSTTPGNDFANNTIAAKAVSTSVDGQLSENATGSKDVGERAKGTVTIYNSSNSPQELSGGTHITSTNGLVFTLDNDVTVASASGDIFSGTKPGTTDVTVTANDIGATYNLPSGTQFSVDSSSSLAAKNNAAFSGGTKKTVTVVSKNDITKLQSDLAKQLQQNAIDQLTKQASGDEAVLPVVLNETLSTTNFDKQVGDQANTVKITGTETFSGLAYNTTDLIQFSQALLKSKYSQAITFAANSIKATVNNAKQKDTMAINATVAIQAGLLPKIDTDTILSQIHGKSVAQAKATLMTLPQVSNATIKFSPPLPLISSFLPGLPKHVDVEIKPESS